MGFFLSIISAAVDVALTPVAIIKDSVTILQGEEPEATKFLVESAEENLSNAIYEIMGD